MNGGDRVGRRTLLRLAGIAAVPMIVGCSHTDDTGPQVTREQVQQLQDRYARTMFKAIRTRDRSLLRTVEAGDLLDRDLSTIALAERLDQPRSTDEFTYPDSTGYPVASTTDGEQQKLITVGNYSNTTAPWRNLGLYVRQGAAGPWLRTFSGGIYADDVPAFTADAALTPIAPDSTGYAAVPNSVPSMVAKALQDPESADAKRFAASDVRQRFADDLTANNSKAADMGPVTRSYSPGGFLIALTIDGGYLALGGYSFSQTVTSSSGKKVYFAKSSPEHQHYSGHYRRAVSEWEGMFAAIVPQAGKLTLVSGEERQTGLKVS